MTDEPHAVNEPAVDEAGVAEPAVDEAEAAVEDDLAALQTERDSF